MEEKRQELIAQAKKRYLKIFPCSHKTELNECFTEANNRLMFWFNTEDNTTHVIATHLDDT